MPHTFTLKHADYPHHVGFVTALVRQRGGEWHKLSIENDVDPTAVQIVCACGWHSPRMYAPLGAKWIRFAFVVQDGEDNEDNEGYGRRVAWPIWRAHLASVPRADEVNPIGGCYGSADLVKRCGDQEREPLCLST